MSQIVKFKTSEGHEFTVPVRLVIHSVTIKGMLDEEGFDYDEFIPLDKITKETFEKVLVYLEHIEAGNAVPVIEKPVCSSDMKDVTTQFYADFVNLENDPLQDLIMAANWLDIKDLVALCCAKMGSMIRGLSIAEFRVLFNIVNDFTPEEEAEPFDEAKLAELAQRLEQQQNEEQM